MLAKVGCDPARAYVHAMSSILPWRRKTELAPKREEDPNPLWALAVGLVYVFRTGPGHQLMRDLEAAVRRYAADPAALWRLVQEGEDVIDTTAQPGPPKPLPPND
jgi:hypothetical protein